jgi:hypothetical protein
MISNRNFKIANGVILIILIIGISYLYNKSGYKKSIDVITKDHYTIQNHTIDSLERTIDSLQLEIKVQGDGFDYKELRYEETIFRYELGIEHIKHYHREAYEEFVRISQFKEHYDRETEREFKQRNDLKTIKIKEKWN